MRKLDTSIYEKFDPSILYIEDIKELAEVLSELGKDLEIRTSSYVLDNVEELENIDKLGARISYLE